MMKKCHQSNLLKATSSDTLAGLGAVLLLGETIRFKSVLKDAETQRWEIKQGFKLNVTSTSLFLNLY